MNILTKIEIDGEEKENYVQLVNIILLYEKTHLQ